MQLMAITEEHIAQLKEIDKKGDLLNAIRELDIAENFESLTDPIGQYVYNNREKISNEERTRRAKGNTKTNVKENSRNLNRKITQEINSISQEEIISPELSAAQLRSDFMDNLKEARALQLNGKNKSNVF